MLGTRTRAAGWKAQMNPLSYERAVMTLFAGISVCYNEFERRLFRHLRKERQTDLCLRRPVQAHRSPDLLVQEVRHVQCD